MAFHFYYPSFLLPYIGCSTHTCSPHGHLYMRTIPPVPTFRNFMRPSGSQRYTACNATHLISCVVPQPRRLTCADSARAGAQSRLSVTDESLDQGGDERTLAYKRAEVLFNSVVA